MGTAVAKLTATLVTKINAAHRAAYGNAQKAFEKAAECGRLLIEAKELVEHGDWIPWLVANTEIGPRQAQKYMRLANNWPMIEAKCEVSNSLFDLDEALKSIAEPKPKALPKPEPEDKDEDEDEDEPTRLVERGARDDGDDEPGDSLELCRRRALLNAASEAMRYANLFADFLAKAEPSEIDAEVSTAAWDAIQFWERARRLLLEKRRATLPQDGRNEVAGDDPIPPNDDFDLGDIPACLLRRQQP